MVPPAPGTGKKGSGINRQRSRNTTPSSGPPAGSVGIPVAEQHDTKFLESLQLQTMKNLAVDDLSDSRESNSAIPDSRSLDGLIERLGKMRTMAKDREARCDRGMRLMATVHREMILMDGIKKEIGSEDAHNEGVPKKENKKKRKAASGDNSHNNSLGPHDKDKSRLDGPSPHRERDTNGKPRKVSRESNSSSLSPIARDTPSASAMDVDDKKKKGENGKSTTKDEEESSEDEGAPPRREAPQHQTFGLDPSTFPDPTIYDIRPTKAGMSDEQLKENYSVAVFPETDLADLIAGDPPDKDFSNAKPSNQIAFNTFSTFIEPYFRPYTEEDLAFLRERGDRATSFLLPKRGKRHYSEIWAEDDGAMAIDNPLQNKDKLPPNQPRGNIDMMNDDVAETDKLSTGPLLSRLLQAMRPEARAQTTSEDKPMVNGMNGINGMNSINGDSESRDENNSSQVNLGSSTTDDGKTAIPPATYMTESSTEAWKKTIYPKLDYMQTDERIKSELRTIGFLPQEGFDAEYDEHVDDEVTARLRLLQNKLRDQMLVNGARKNRISDLVKDRMAFQEFQTISEDLDGQVQAAYQKRTRTMGKSKKAKRPGGAGGGTHPPAGNAAAGMARPGIGDLTKTVMERRRRWLDAIGPIFDDESLGKVPRSADPDSTIFKPDIMTQLVKKERQSWNEEEEE